MRFNGDKKTGQSILFHPENRLKAWLLPKVPEFIETYHLTLMSIIWAFMNIVFCFLGRYNIQWLWGMSAMIVLQYITDLLDGAIGRERKTGLIKWGYFMDHFLDYLFICSLLIGYSLLITDHNKIILFFILALFIGFMINSFLSFAATNQFRISYLGIGPTEVRIIFILINVILIYLPNNKVIESVLPLVLIVSTLALFITVYRTQKELWELDMKNKIAEAGKTGKKILLEEQARMRNMRVLWNYSISFLLLSSAFVTLYIRFMAPYHRIIALVLFGAALTIYLVSAFIKQTKQEKRPKKNLFLRAAPYLIFTLLIGLFAYVSWALVPFQDSKRPALQRSILEKDLEIDLKRLSDTRTDLETAIQSFERSLQKNDTASINKNWQSFSKDYNTLESLQKKYDLFYTVDHKADPEFHSKAFLLCFSSYALKYLGSVRLVSSLTRNPIAEKELATTEAPFKIRRNTYRNITKSIHRPEEIMRLNAWNAYLQLIKKDLNNNTQAVNQLEEDFKKIQDYYESNPDILLEHPIKTIKGI